MHAPLQDPNFNRHNKASVSTDEKDSYHLDRFPLLPWHLIGRISTVTMAADWTTPGKYIHVPGQHSVFFTLQPGDG